VAQVAYYFAAAVALGAPARKISFAVPTGNFGNVYAAYCAKQMGLPIENLIIGSNRNDILTRFFETGSMTTQTVEPSLSPSMDIQVSSNFERFLFDLVGRKPEIVRGHMNSLKQSGSFTIDKKLMEKARGILIAQRCSDAQTSVMMAECFHETGYTIDPHTAVGLYAAGFAPQNHIIPLIALACAHPAKFPDAVESATGIHPALPAHLADLFERKEIFSVLPNDLSAIQKFIRACVNK
jgi:threonine synthase